MSQPDPQAQQMKQAQDQLAMQTAQAQLALYDAQTKKATADANKTIVETQILPAETEAKMIGNIARNSGTDAEFDKKIKIAELALKEKEINHNMDVVQLQMRDKKEKQAKDQAFKNQFKV
jgi:hypothetical protein